MPPQITKVASLNTRVANLTDLAPNFMSLQDAFAADLIKLADNTVLISNAMLTTLGISGVAEYQIGKKRFYLANDILDDAQWHANYPRRSAREQAVAARNQKIIEVILEF